MRPPNTPETFLAPDPTRTFGAPAIKHRLKSCSLTDIKCTDALRSVDLVAGDGKQIAANLLHPDGNFRGSRGLFPYRRGASRRESSHPGEGDWLRFAFHLRPQDPSSPGGRWHLCR